MMNDQYPCEKWAEKLAARHQEDLTSQERLDLQKHLDECPACAAQYQAYQSLEVKIRALPVPEPSLSLLPKLRGLREKEKGQLVPSSTERIDKINSAREGVRWVLTVGINSVTQANIPSLHFAERDAQDFAAILQQQTGDKWITTTILGEEATSYNIIYSLHTLVQKAKENDEIVLYFAGHGLSSEIQGQSLIPYDWDGQNGVTNALSIEQISDLISRSVAKRVLVVLDACFAGGIDQQSRLPSFGIQERLAGYFARSEHDESLALVASTTSQEQLAESNEHESLSTLLRRVLPDKGAVVTEDHTSEAVTDLQQFYRYLEEAITE